MIRRLLTLGCAAGIFACGYAQYYGAPVFVEGFDGTEMPEGWVQNNRDSGSRTQWSVSGKEVADFSSIVADNKGSAKISVQEKTAYVTLTSPEIDATEYAGMQAGFYGYELSYAFRGNIDFRFRISNDGGSTWTDLFASLDGSSFNQNRVGDWNLYRYTLPDEFDHSRIRLQFLIDASTAFSNPQGLPGYIDGVFISRVADIDPELAGINYSTNDKIPSSGVYRDAEPVTVTVRNLGMLPLEGAELWYRVDNGEEVVENVVFPSPLNRGESEAYTFDAKADLSRPRGHMRIYAGVRVDDDANEENNRLTAYVDNQVTAIPYVPAFYYKEDGVEVVGKDGWTTFENNKEDGWTLEDWKDVYWYVDPESNRTANDAYLVSRPILMEGGVSYRLQFAALTDDPTSVDNSMKIYVAPDPRMLNNPMQIWEDDAIGADNDQNAMAVFSVEETGIYYIGFRSVSEPGAGMMRLDKIALYKNVDVDVALASVVTPAAGGYTYGEAEKVKLRVTNNGMNNIRSGHVTATVTVDGEKAIEETISSVQSGATREFTLKGTLDLSRLGHPYDIKVSLSLDDDEDKSNDSLSYTVESDVTALPYIPDLGTQVSKGRDVARWTAEDSDADGYTFTPFGDSLLDSYSFSYGGGAYGFTTVTLPSEDDHLWSRHMDMEGGKSYRLTYNSRIGAYDASMPLDVNLWKTDATGKRTFVSSIFSGKEESPEYVEHNIDFDVPEDGIYQIEFAVKGDSPVDYRIYLGKFRVAESYAKDLSVEEVVVPSRYVSEIKSLPVGATVRNNGSETIDTFSLSYKCGDRTASADFKGVGLEPNGTYLIYFPNDLKFDTNGRETLVVSLSAEGDEYAGNDSAEVTLEYLAPAALPYNPMPETGLERMEVFNLNRDNYRFMTDRSQGVGVMYLADGSTSADDYVATPALRMESGKGMRVSFSYHMLEGDTTEFDVFAYDASRDEKVPVISYGAATQSTMSRYIGYFEVPESGDYQICFRPQGKTVSLFISASVSVEEAAGYPDIRIGRLLSHTSGAVLGKNERVEVEFLSDSEFGVQCVPFELEDGEGHKWYSVFTKYTAKTDDDFYTVVFDGVDLETPGKYELTCRALVPMDLTPANNVKSFIVESLPVYDMTAVSLVTPVSGKLGTAEKVKVRLANNGKGSVSDVPVKVTVSNGGKNVATLEGKLTETLPAGESVDYELPGSVAMFDEGVYVFLIEVGGEGDINPEDNRLSVSVNSTAKDFDTGVSRIVSPVDDALGNDTKVTIEVTNYGETPVFDVPVSAEVIFDGETEPTVLSGSVPEVAAGASVEYTLPGTVDMSRCGAYTISASTAIPGDADASNDKSEKIVRCLTQDVGVSAIISPVSGEDLGVCDVIVEVSNYGEADVKDIPLMYQIGRMPQLAVMEGVLPRGETREFTFPVPYEFTSYRTMTVTVATTLENDVDHSNDSISAEVINSPAGVDEIVLGSGLYPNPAHEYVKVTASSVIAKVYIFDMDGKCVLVSDGDGDESVDISLSIAAGHYVVVVETEFGRSAYRLVVK